MGAWSDYIENKVIDWLFRAQTYTPPTTLYYALFTTNENDANSGAVEVSGGSYARVGVACSLANFAGTQSAGSTTASTGTSATTSNNGVITFPTPTASWGVVTGMGTFDAATGGNLITYCALTTSKTINNGDPAPTFPAASWTHQMDT